MSPPGRAPRPNALIAAMVIGIATVPPAAFAADPEQAKTTAPGSPAPSDAPPAILHGRVTDEAGAPLPDVRVRVAIPATDMRFIDDVTDRRFMGDVQEHGQIEVKTDARGDYRMQIPGLSGRTRISMDAMKPGYRRLVGTLMSGGDPRNVELGPGDEAEASLILRPALYFAGKVVDEQGQPIAGVQVSANASFTMSSGGVERTATRPDGSFELFNYTEKSPAIGRGKARAMVFFFHPDYIDHRIDDLHRIEPGERTTLRVVLPTGHKIAGTVVDAAGKPVPNAMIKITRKDGGHRKAVMTDANGRFAIRGLSPGLTLLVARCLPIKQTAQMPMALNGDRTDLEVRLRPIPLPANLPKYAVLGMQLTDMTPELKSAYNVFNDRGALILDPGKDTARLKIGELAEGYVFWMVGQKRIGSVREFVDRILAETAGQNAEHYQIRVVYTFSTVDFDGTNTQYLQLTKDDLKQLQGLSDRLAPEP